jgi:L-asparagine transporter-like permease
MCVESSLYVYNNFLKIFLDILACCLIMCVGIFCQFMKDASPFVLFFCHIEVSQNIMPLVALLVPLMSTVH